MKGGKKEITKNVSKFIFIALIISAFVTFFDLPAFSQAREFRSITAVEFYDGTIIQGQIIEMNADIIKIRKSDGRIETRKFNEASRFYKEGDTSQEVTQQQTQGLKPYAQQSYTKKHNGEFGLGLSYITYKEPDLDVEEKGVMFGLAGSYTYHNKLMLKLEGIANFGTVDYSSPSGELDNITDYMLEGRILVGYDFSLSHSFMITPYVGFGYRYLNDDSSGKITSRGARGYERESNYYYSPIGLMAWTKLGQGWVMKITAEYDYFWEGKQKSHLGDAVFGFPTVENKQNDGYGLRGSVKFEKNYGGGSFAIEPFIRYWKIDDSEIEFFNFRGFQFAAYEPENKSTEIGVLFSLVF